MVYLVLKDKSKYKHNDSGDVYTLKLDYNGLWYLSKRDEKGLTKFLSVRAEDMVEVLYQHFDPVVK